MVIYFKKGQKGQNQNGVGGQFMGRQQSQEWSPVLSAPVFSAATILKMVTFGSVCRKCILDTSCKWKLGGMLRLS